MDLNELQNKELHCRIDVSESEFYILEHRIEELERRIDDIAEELVREGYLHYEYPVKGPSDMAYQSVGDALDKLKKVRDEIKALSNK